MQTKKIHKNKIREILNKISILVDIYAKVHSLEKYVFGISHDVGESYVPLLMVHTIDFKSYIKQEPDVNAIRFSRELSGLLSDSELEMLFIKKHYPDYATIHGIVQKILYKIPKEIDESDLIELNKLYKKYIKHDKNKTAKDNNL